MSQNVSIPIECVRGRCCRRLDGEETTRFFRALADPNRVALLARLADSGRACTVSEIACCLPIELSVVSRHLAQMREAGILATQKHGREVLYRVRYDAVAAILRELAEVIESCCMEPSSEPPSDQSPTESSLTPSSE